jgi:serine/threonine protein kinase
MQQLRDQHVQEFCNGYSLREAIDSGLFLPQRKHCWRRLTSMLHGIVEGLTYIHNRRICHGDLNPQSIMLHVRQQNRVSATCISKTYQG